MTRCDEILALGDIVEIEAGGMRVHTKLQEISQEGDLIVFQPTIKNMPLRAEEYENYKISCYKQNGVYMFEAELVLTFIKDEVWLSQFRQVSEVKRIQRRQYYRLPIVLKAELSLFDKEQKNVQDNPCKARTINLSERGVLLSCYTKFSEGTDVTVRIKLSDEETLVLQGTILRCNSPLSNNEPHNIVILFNSCPARDTTTLRRYIFKEQILARNRGIK